MQLKYRHVYIFVTDWKLSKRLFSIQLVVEISSISWWRHQMEAFSALLAICAGNSPVPGEFPTQRPVTWSFDVYFDLCPNKRLSKQSWGWWFQMPLRPLWRHRNDGGIFASVMWQLSHLQRCKITRSLSHETEPNTPQSLPHNQALHPHPTGPHPLQWRRNECDGVSNHRRLHCLLNCWFRRTSKKTSKLRVTGLCAGNSPVTGEFPAQKASNAGNVHLMTSPCPKCAPLHTHILNPWPAPTLTYGTELSTVTDRSPVKFICVNKLGHQIMSYLFGLFFYYFDKIKKNFPCKKTYVKMSSEKWWQLL